MRVTMTFTPAAAVDGTNNRYEYTVQNLTSNLTARLFRVANPGMLPRTLISPAGGWAERVDVQNFIWEGGSIAPGSSAGTFTLLTPALLPDLTSPPDPINDIGWIETEDGANNRVDIFGPVIHNQ
jgi:hypothetical protein